MATIVLWAKTIVFLYTFIKVKMLNLGHIFVLWLRFIDYIAVSALKMLKACLSIFFQFCYSWILLNLLHTINFCYFITFLNWSKDVNLGVEIANYIIV